MEPIRSTQLSNSAEHHVPLIFLLVSECSPEGSHIYAESDSEMDPPRRRASRQGSNPYTHSQGSASCSIELWDSRARVHAKIYKETVEFWKSKEGEWLAFSISSGGKARLPGYLENLITSRMLLKIWSDLEYNFPDYKELGDQHIFLRALRTFFRLNGDFNR